MALKGFVCRLFYGLLRKSLTLTKDAGIFVSRLDMGCAAEAVGLWSGTRSYPSTVSMSHSAMLNVWFVSFCKLSLTPAVVNTLMKVVEIVVFQVKKVQTEQSL